MQRYITCTVMSRDYENISIFKGDISVNKSTDGSKWLITEFIPDDAIKSGLYDKESVTSKYPVDKYFIILS